MSISPQSVVGYSSSRDEEPLPGANSLTLLQLPDEMLVEIFLYLRGEERIMIGATCRRFKSLIFSDKKLLRRLDFSESYHRGLADIEIYLSDCHKIFYTHELIIRNNCCISSRKILTKFGYVNKLVEIDIVGTKLRTITEIKKLLGFLKHVTRFSTSWLETQTFTKQSIHNILQEEFGRLKYLYLHVLGNTESMLYALELCQELVELVVLTTKINRSNRTSMSSQLSLSMLKNLKKFVCVNVSPYKRYKCNIQLGILKMLPDPKEWVFLYYDEKSSSCYIEKKTEIPKEYTNDILGAESGSWFDKHFQCAPSVLRSTLLLKEAMVFTKGEIVNANLQRLLSVSDMDFMISIRDTKKLLQNPRHEITHVNIQPREELKSINVCSALTDFPGLKKLVLPSVSRSRAPRRSEDECTPVPLNRKRISRMTEVNTLTADSPFRKLTQTAPYMESFTIIAGPLIARKKEEEEALEWDLPALVFISNWKNLTVLCLVGVPIVNGKFLIDIGVNCKGLKELTLKDLGPEASCVYTQELYKMLEHCRNLRSFVMSQRNFGQIAPLLAALKNSSKLEQVGIKSLGLGTKVSCMNISAMQLIESTKIVLFICKIEAMFKGDIHKLRSKLNRLRKTLPRPALRYDIIEHYRPLNIPGLAMNRHWEEYSYDMHDFAKNRELYYEMPPFLQFCDTTIAQQLHVL